MASLGTVMTVIDAVNKAIEAYKKIDSVPEQMKSLATHLRRVNTCLSMLESLYKRKPTNALAGLRPAQKAELLDIVNSIRGDAEKALDFFDRWKNDIGPLGLQFRFKVVTQAYFALGTSMEKIQGLEDSLEMDMQYLRDLLQIMGAEDLKVILAAQAKTHAAIAAAVAAATLAGNPPAATLSPGAVAGGTQPATAPSPRLSPSPSPTPPRKDNRIIFVDPHNVGRSVVAMACMHLLKEWTQRTGGDWRTTYAHSAGFFLRRRSDIADVIENMPYSRKGFKHDLIAGGAPPAKLALDAVFDNGLYAYPFKATVRDTANNHRSRGLTKEIFKAYDYIVVFTGREHDNMIQLRKTLREKGGGQLTPNGKGRVLHLGSYIKSSSGVPKEIIDTKKGQDGTQTREDWNGKVAEVKIALKAFLKQELHWRQPPKGAIVKI
jgi:protein-tyrosine-phosphatase